MNLAAIWKIFSVAPHRMFFFGGMMQSTLTLIWWLIDLGGRYGWFYAPVVWAISPTDAHAWLMIYGFFPFFIFGFLMTTYPRWMNGEEVERNAYVPAFLMMAVGGLLFYVGLVLGVLMVKIALSLFLAGWSMGLYGLLRVYIRAKHPDKRHASITSAVLTLGWLLMVGFMLGSPFFIELAKVCGIWVVLLPVFFAVSHRMIPFFSANVIVGYQVVRPGWALVLIPVGALLHAVLDLAGMLPWLWMTDLPMAAGALYLTYVWQLRKSLAVPILGMLHIGFAWLGIALLLSSAQSLIFLATGQLMLAKAPLHALTIGYFTSMLLAMASRVTLGHSGRLLAADRLTWGLFLVFQSVAVLRVLSEIPGLGLEIRNHLYLGAAIVWLACFSLWSWKFAPIYWKPRFDGRPG